MDNEKISEPAFTKAKIYLENLSTGKSKVDSKVLAGYSPKNINVEKTKAFAVALNEMLTKNDNSLSLMLTAIEESVASGIVEKLTLEKQVDIAKRMAEIRKIITPQVTIKEEQMKDGTMKRTVWGQASATGQQETPQIDTGEDLEEMTD